MAAGRRATLAVSEGAAREAESPFRSDDDFDYFKREKRVSAELAKPLGAVLEAAETGVVVAELEEGGSASASGLLKKGDRLAAVMGRDVSAAPFEEVMELLRSAPDAVLLEVTRSVVVRKPRAVPADAGPARPTPPPDKLEAAFQKNFGSSEAAGKLGTKIFKTITNPVTWKNDIYFWSLMSVVVPLALLAGYSALK
jgi:hypothetical protein